MDACVVAPKGMLCVLQKEEYNASAGDARLLHVATADPVGVCSLCSDVKVLQRPIIAVVLGRMASTFLLANTRHVLYFTQWSLFTQHKPFSVHTLSALVYSAP